jgi:hypothetical protein
MLAATITVAPNSDVLITLLRNASSHWMSVSVFVSMVVVVYNNITYSMEQSFS